MDNDRHIVVIGLILAHSLLLYSRKGVCSNVISLNESFTQHLSSVCFIKDKRLRGGLVGSVATNG